MAEFLRAGPLPCTMLFLDGGASTLLSGQLLALHAHEAAPQPVPREFGEYPLAAFMDICAKKPVRYLDMCRC